MLLRCTSNTKVTRLAESGARLSQSLRLFVCVTRGEPFVHNHEFCFGQPQKGLSCVVIIPPV